MSQKAAFMRAIKKHGPKLDGVARRYGLTGTQLLAKLYQGESGFKMGAVSNKGARGGGQFMPGTRQAVLQKYGIDPWRSPEESVQASVLHLQGKLGHRKGLEGYNPGGGQSYVNYILKQKVNVGGGAPAAGGALPAPGRVRATRGPGGVAVDTDAALIDALLKGTGKPVTTAARAVATGAYTRATPGTLKLDTRGATVALPPGVKGKVKGKPLDRPGVHTRPEVLNFVRKAAGIYGSPITLGTGTAHSRMTVDGNVSAHWDGNAIDLPATGAALVRLGQSLLIAAGANPNWARKQRGGLYNIGGWQIIFATSQGGNHHNHAHAGRRRR